MHTHAHWRRNVLQWDQSIRAAGFRENGRYTSFFSFSFWPSGAYFIPHKIDQAYGQVNMKSHSWSPTAWTWIEAVCSLIQSFGMCGISCEQRNKQTEKVVASCRLGRISEMTYSGLGLERQTDAKLFLACFPCRLCLCLPRGLGSCSCPSVPVFVTGFAFRVSYVWKHLFDSDKVIWIWCHIVMYYLFY